MARPLRNTSYIVWSKWQRFKAFLRDDWPIFVVVLLCVFIVLSVPLQFLGIKALQENMDEVTHRADIAEERAQELEGQIDSLLVSYQDTVNSQRTASCRTEFASEARAEMLRGNAAVLRGLAAYIKGDLTQGDLAEIEDRAQIQQAEAIRQDSALALCLSSP